MLDNDTTLEWEGMISSLMLSFNCHVHKATLPTPFFLTYLHNPRLPYFDLDRPTPNYTNNYVTDAYEQLQESYKLVADNIKEAKELHKKYYD